MDQFIVRWQIYKKLSWCKSAVSNHDIIWILGGAGNVPSLEIQLAHDTMSVNGYILKKVWS